METKYKETGCNNFEDQIVVDAKKADLNVEECPSLLFISRVCFSHGKILRPKSCKKD